MESEQDYLVKMYLVRQPSFFFPVICYLEFLNSNNHLRLIKEFDREIKVEESKNPPEVNKQLNDEKQSMVSSLDPYIADQIA